MRITDHKINWGSWQAALRGVVGYINVRPLPNHTTIFLGIRLLYRVSAASAKTRK